MKTSINGIVIIKSYEGLKLKAYKCPSGIWTIGWGRTKGVKEGMVITEAQAEIFLQEDVAEAERCVIGKALHINQNQFDALVSFVFNLGCLKFTTSTLLKRIKDKASNEEITRQFNRWKYDANGKVLPGLVRRRKEEAELYCR